MSDDFVQALTEIIAAEGLESLCFTPDLTNAASLAALRADLSTKRLTLVLGAGVSKDSKLAEWRPLVADAASAVLRNTAYGDVADLVTISRLNATTAVRFLEHTLGMSTGFRSILMRELYRNYDPSAANRCLESACDLILGDGSSPAVSNVITYNFDNLMELRLEQEVARRGLGHRVYPVYSLESYAAAENEPGIRVYHVHGYLPHDTEWSEYFANPVVFSERDYHRHYFDYTFWANLVQLRAFTSSHCLFVGLSMTDPNMRRLLDHAKGETPMPRHHGIVKIVADSSAARVSEIENFVRYADLESMGVNTVWVREYSEIPDLLNALT